MTTDRQKISSQLEQSFSSAAGASCLLQGGGPSLGEVDAQLLEQLPVPRMGINLAGTGKIRPHFWTAYDSTQRFSRSTYLDASVMKFVHRRRAMDLVPETSWKICECPNLYFFEGDASRGFSNFLSRQHQQIVDWNDSFVQAIDIAYRLGFRTLYLLGCEMKVEPTAEMRQWSATKQIDIPDGAGMTEFMKCLERKGYSRQDLENFEQPQVYHFAESKSLPSLLATDFHYYRVAQYLRLSRGSLAEAGMRIVSLTPGSRLNEFFPQLSWEEATTEIFARYGNPALEQTEGRYSATTPRTYPGGEWMRDFFPLHWTRDRDKPQQPRNVEEPGGVAAVSRQQLDRQLAQCQQADLLIQEQG